MKKNDTGDFCVLYIEEEDERTSIFQHISEQKKPVVLMLIEAVQAFQRPDDFSSLKRVKRQLDLPIVFVIPPGGQLAQMAARNGFPVYLSMDALADALSMGQLTRARSSRVTNPLGSGASHTIAPKSAANGPRKTVPLIQPQSEPEPTYGAAASLRTAPLAGTPSSPRHAPIQSTSAANVFEQKVITPLHPGDLSVSNGNHQSNGSYGSKNGSSGNHGVLPRNTATVTEDRVSANGHAAVPVRRARVSTPLAPEVSQRRTDPLARPPRYSKPLGGRPGAVAVPRLSVQETRKRSRRVSPILIVLTVALFIGIVGAVLVLPHPFQTDAPGGTAPGVVGELVFSNSEHLSESSTQGIADQVTINLTGIDVPTAHKSYYAWLLEDKNQTDPKALLLGTMTVSNGKARLFYGGDNQHTNLLLTMSRFLVTEEDSMVKPLAPSPDQGVWRFYGELSATPLPATNGGKSFSYLDHIRHLLASDPTLNELELPGGLNNWFYRNTVKVSEWVGSMREVWEEGKDTAFIRRQLMRALEFLDGVSFVSRDLPPNTPLLVNERLARVGLIQVAGPDQDPPSYMSHIIHHLNGLLQAGGSTTALRKQIAPLVTALANIEQWLSKVRTDGQKLMKMTDAELLQKGGDTLNVINDMISNANSAYTGAIDPTTNQMRQGATWVHQQMQMLASVTISKVTPATNKVPQPQMPGSMRRASGPIRAN